MTEHPSMKEARTKIIDNLKEVVEMRRVHHAKIQQKLEFARAEAGLNRGHHEGETLDWLMKEISAENERFLQESGVSMDKSITILRDAMMTDLKAKVQNQVPEPASLQGMFVKYEDVHKLVNDLVAQCVAANETTRGLAVKQRSLVLLEPLKPELELSHKKSLREHATKSIDAFVDSGMAFSAITSKAADLLGRSALTGKLVLENPVPKETPQ